MKKLHFEILISAPRKKVWDNIVNDKPFRTWMGEFAAGAHFEGNWEKGAKIRFLTKDENGKTIGAFSEIADNRLYEFISIKHLGLIKDGIDDVTSREANEWTPVYENYTLLEMAGGTKFMVDMDADEAYIDMFNELWPRAILKLKEVSEI